MVFGGVLSVVLPFGPGVIATPPSLQPPGQADRLSKIRPKIRHNRKLA